MDESRKIKKTISILKELREFCVCSVERYYMSKCSIKALSYAIEILEKKVSRLENKRIKNIKSFFPPISKKACKWWRGKYDK